MKKRKFKRVVIISIILLLILLGVFYIFYTSNKELFLSPAPYPPLPTGAICWDGSKILGICPLEDRCFIPDGFGDYVILPGQTGYGIIQILPGKFSGRIGKCLRFCWRGSESIDCNDNNPCTDDKCSPYGNCYYMAALSINPAGCDAPCGKCVNKVCVNNNDYCVRDNKDKSVEICNDNKIRIVYDICKTESFLIPGNFIYSVIQVNCPKNAPDTTIRCKAECVGTPDPTERGEGPARCVGGEGEEGYCTVTQVPSKISYNKGFNPCSGISYSDCSKTIYLDFNEYDAHCKWISY